MVDRPEASTVAQRRWFPYGPGAELTPAVTADGGFPLPTMGAGLVRCDAGHSFSWLCPNDETIFIVHGRAEITGGGHTAVAEDGEFIYLPEGVTLDYAFPVETLVAWVAHPRAAVEKAVERLENGEH